MDTQSDSFGEFTLGDIPEGPLDVHIRADGNQEILVAGIDPTFPEPEAC